MTVRESRTGIALCAIAQNVGAQCPFALGERLTLDIG